jgi:hypothetical protein
MRMGTRTSIVIVVVLIAWVWAALRGGDDAPATRATRTGDGPGAATSSDLQRQPGKLRPPRLVVDRPPVPAVPLPRSIVGAWQEEIRGEDARHPVDIHGEQLRVEPWAGAMEEQLRARFSRRRLEPLGLTTMRLDELDCRQSSCRLEISWGDADLEATRQRWPRGKRWPDAGEFLTTMTGGLAMLETRVRPQVGEAVVPDSWHVRRRVDGRYAVTTVVLFGEEDIDPARYSAVIDRRSAPTSTSTSAR